MLRPEDYLKALRGLLRRVHTRELSPLWRDAGRADEWFKPGIMSHRLAHAYAVLWKLQGREKDSRAAKRLLLGFTRTAPYVCNSAGTAYQILKPGLTREEREGFGRRWAEQAMEPLVRHCSKRSRSHAYGNNHKITACTQADLVRKLFPKIAAPYRFERYTDPVWRDWWARRDFQEQATNYEALSEQLHCVWAQIRGVEKAFYRSSSIRNMFERHMLTVTPSGLVAAYGDCGHPPRPSVWMAIFELVARKTRDGRFRQCAEELFRRCRRTRYWQHLGPPGKLPRMPRYLARSIFRELVDECASLADAAVACDARVQPQPRPRAGRIRRLPKNAVLKPSERDGGTIADARLCTQQVALVGGSDPKTYLLLSVGPALVHDHADAGAIQLLAKGDAELLGTSGYLMREQYFHNTFFAQEADRPCFPDDRREEGSAGSRSCGGTVERIETGPDYGYCRIRLKCFHDLPASLVREVTVQRTGEVTLVDRLSVHQGKLRAGLLFHAERLRRVGNHAFVLRSDLLRTMNGAEVPNGAGSLRGEFAAGDGEAEVRSLACPAIFDASPTYQRFPCTGYKKLWRSSYTAKKCLAYSRVVEPGEEAVWVTVLRPEPEG